MGFKADANFAELQRVQNSLARAVCQSPYNTYAIGMLPELHWLPVKHRITYKVATINYCTCRSSQPAYLRKLHIDYQLPARTLHSSISH